VSEYKLYCGDCLAILPTLEAGSVDAVITDSPYSEKTHAGARSVYDYGPKGGVIAIDFPSVDASYIRQVLSVCCPRKWCISFVDWHHALPLEENPPTGLEFIRLGIWVKRNPIPQLTGDRPSTGWEAIAIFHVPGRKEWNGGSGPAVWDNGTSRWGYFGPSNHPTEKPLGLMSKLILQFTDKGDTVIDPFMGSGSTGVACMQLGRNFVGVEILPKYFKIAERRIEQAARQQPLFAETGADGAETTRAEQSEMELR